MLKKSVKYNCKYVCRLCPWFLLRKGISMSQIYVPKRFYGRTGYQIVVDRFYRDQTPLPYIEGRKVKSWDDWMPDWQPDPDGVYRNRYYYGGNLGGIIQKLDYIESMGFNLILLGPISKTNTYHHYDVEDQTVIDPYIGSMADFAKLCEEAHKRDILVGVDLVFNHFGSQSEFFQKAMAGEGYFKDWFEWKENGNPVYWYGFTDMPQTNKMSANFKEYVYYVLETYIRNGADCIRLDLGENLPESFMQDVRQKIKELNPEVLIVSEMWGLATKKDNPQIFDGRQADSIMNYPMADDIIRWVRTGNHLHFNYNLSEISKYPENVQNVLWNMLDSHDTPRAKTMLGGAGIQDDPFKGGPWDIEEPWRYPGGFDTYAFRKFEADNDSNLHKDSDQMLMLASTIQYLVKGIPVVFYATEVGMDGYKDPFCRKPFSWNSQNETLREHYRKLGMLRRQNKDILSDGDMDIICDSELMFITRRSRSGSIVAILSRNNAEMPVGFKARKQNILFQLNSNDPNIGSYGAVVCRF